jgi:hypothetical protein
MARPVLRSKHSSGMAARTSARVGRRVGVVVESAKAAVVSVNMDRQHGRWPGLANNRWLRGLVALDAGSTHRQDRGMMIRTRRDVGGRRDVIGSTGVARCAGNLGRVGVAR